MKRKLIFLLVAFAPSTVFAQNCTAPNGSPWPDCIPTDDFIVMLGKVIDIFLILTGSVAVLFIIIGGFQYITSAGNPENVGKAKNTVLYAIIGLIVVILSYAIVKFIIDNIK